MSGAHNASASVELSGPQDMRKELERLESRINQLIQAVDEQRTNFHRTLTAILVFVCTGIIAWVAYAIYSDRMDRMEPPRVQSFAPVPVKVGDETVMLGVGIVEWKVPQSVDALLDKVAKAEVELREERRKELLERQQKLQKKAKP